MKNKNKRIIQQGAEAIIYLDDNRIIKERTKKSYRIKEIDEKLRKSRTKKEAKILTKIKGIISSPNLIKTNDRDLIEMSYIDGLKLSDNLENLDYIKIAKKIGEAISKLHTIDIIHGDLTTSNMIYRKNENKVYIIDFGLSFNSHKIEDKAVDLHLLKQALEAKHFRIYKEVIDNILKNYKTEKSKDVIERIKKIESRGRYKEKY